MPGLTPEIITWNPDCLTRTLTIPSGEPLTFRVLRPEDGTLLGRYFEGLSQETRRRYAPHPLDRETGHQLCAEIDYADTLRFVVLTQSQAEIIAYFILRLGTSEGDRQRYQERGLPLDDETDCALAPSVADARQSRGVGSAVMPAVLEVARRLGRRRMVLSGGTQATNYRAIRFYEKFGFRRVGDFMVRDLNNHDMILDLC